MRYRFWYGRPAHACSYSGSHSRHAPYESRHGYSRSGSDFGVRRPLRYLRYRLDLDESQTRRIAAVLNRLKLEREQGQVDDKRALQALADLVMANTVSEQEIGASLAARTRAAERLQGEVTRSLIEICDILDDDQREEFADLLRSGLIAL